MRSDFKPLHLQEANKKLERELSSAAYHQTQEDETPVCEEESVQSVSLWKKFLGLFKTSASEFPDDLYK